MRSERVSSVHPGTGIPERTGPAPMRPLSSAELAEIESDVRALVAADAGWVGTGEGDEYEALLAAALARADERGWRRHLTVRLLEAMPDDAPGPLAGPR